MASLKYSISSLFLSTETMPASQACVRAEPGRMGRVGIAHAALPGLQNPQPLQRKIETDFPTQLCNLALAYRPGRW